MSETKDKKEYDRLVGQKEDKQRQYNACADRIEDYDYLLRRLRATKEIVATQKEMFHSIERIDKATVNEKYSWKGSNCDRFKTDGKTMINENEIYYRHSIDYVLDSINNEITRIENLRMGDYGLLGELGSAINSLANKIENFFN